MRKAIVCGGGVAGLSAAIALAMKGWSVQVFERSPSVREIGAGIFIKWNGIQVLRHFGLFERIRRDCVALNEALTLDRFGQVLQRRIWREANPVWNIQRQLLIRALLDRAVELGAEVQTDTPIDVVTPEGTASSGKASHRAELVIAADGVNSVARRVLGLDRAVRAPASGAIRLQVARTPYENADVLREFWSDRLRVGVSPCTPQVVFSYLIAPLNDPRGSRVPVDVDYWASRFPKLAEEGLFERAQGAEAVHHAYPLVGARSWSRGCVALVGDAAHALPPTLGQGAGLSLTNVLLLAEIVSPATDVPAALRSWERQWRWISDRTQNWSRRYDWITSEWPPRLYPLRDALIWGLGRLPRFNRYMRIADRVDAPRAAVAATTAPKARLPG